MPAHEARWAVAGLGLVILVIAMLPAPVGQPSLIGWDKLDHIAAFAALTVLIRTGWPQARRAWAVGVLVLYGAVIELLQASALIGRTASSFDLIANGVGIVLGLAIAFILARARRAVQGG